MKQVYYAELALEEGFKFLHLKKRVVAIADMNFSKPSGAALFASLEGTTIKCYNCKAIADRWVISRGKKDLANPPVMNLYGLKKTRKRTTLVMFNRDHIIPQSLGGVDDVANLRAACETCNGERGNNMSKRDQAFMDKHPELIDHYRRIQGEIRKHEGEIRRLEAEAKLAQQGEQRA